MKWPRKYLLELYHLAITTGECSVSPITQSQAKSLCQSFYRLRRRSDSSTATFITPEHHLVTADDWTPENDGTQRFIFDIPEHLPKPQGGEGEGGGDATASPGASAAGAEASAPEVEIIVPSDLVSALRKSAKERAKPQAPSTKPPPPPTPHD